MPTFKGRKILDNGGSSEDREEQEKARTICSCRRPVKPAGVSVYAVMIRSKEVASCYYSRSKSVSSTPAVQFAPLPSHLSRLHGEGRGADSTVKYWVKLNQRDRAVAWRRYVWVQFRPVFVCLCACETKLKPNTALREEKMSVNR